MTSFSIPDLVMQKILVWLDGPYDAKTKDEIQKLLKTNPKALVDAFYKDLSFGTGGMRGIMGVGTNRMNIYTIRKATEGLAQSIKKGAVFIGYDVRHHSKEFAQESANVLASHNITVFLAQMICPTPLVSFGVRHFNCQAGIMITASHNPPQYNGYKVYWSDGAQVVPPQDVDILQKVNLIQKMVPQPKVPPGLIHPVGQELFTAYLKTTKHLQLYPEIASDAVKIIYSPLHGTGVEILPKALQNWGYHNVHLVKEQSTPDGNFENAPQPNPEERASLALGTKLLETDGGDLFLATDPDADRIGIVEKGPHFFTGNQVACLLLDHVLRSKKFPGDACIKSIVTSELFAKICKAHGILCIDVLTGFKYICEKIAIWEKTQEHRFIFGAEESCGYLLGTDVRDKDAIATACLLAEMKALAQKEKTTLLERLYFLYKTHGIHRDKLLNFSFGDTPEGMEKMRQIMQTLRTNPPKEILSKKITRTEDFNQGLGDIPPSDVLRFWLEDHTKIVVRPSGTEPKLKVYLEAVLPFGLKPIEEQIAHCDTTLEQIANLFTNLFEKRESYTR